MWIPHDMQTYKIVHQSFPYDTLQLLLFSVTLTIRVFLIRFSKLLAAVPSTLSVINHLYSIKNSTRIHVKINNKMNWSKQTVTFCEDGQRGYTHLTRAKKLGRYQFPGAHSGHNQYWKQNTLLRLTILPPPITLDNRLQYIKAIGSSYWWHTR